MKRPTALSPAASRWPEACRGQLCSQHLRTTRQIIFGKQGCSPPLQAQGGLRPLGPQGQARSFPRRCRPAPPALPPDPRGPHSQPGPRTQSRRWLTPSGGTHGALLEPATAKDNQNKAPPSSCCPGAAPGPVGNGRVPAGANGEGPWASPGLATPAAALENPQPRPETSSAKGDEVANVSWDSSDRLHPQVHRPGRGGQGQGWSRAEQLRPGGAPGQVARRLARPRWSGAGPPAFP